MSKKSWKEIRKYLRFTPDGSLDYFEIGQHARLHNSRRVDEEKLLRRHDGSRGYSVMRHMLVRRTQQIRKPTVYEKEVFNKLSHLKHEMQWKPADVVIYQKGWTNGNYVYVSDFYLPKIGLLIEVDGRSHHSSIQAHRDKIRDQWFTDRHGLKTVRVTNEQALKISPLDLKDLLIQKQQGRTQDTLPQIEQSECAPIRQTHRLYKRSS